MTQVTAVAWIRSLAQELPRAAGTANDTKKTKKQRSYIQGKRKNPKDGNYYLANTAMTN